MGSKYDKFWRSRLEEIKAKIKEAIQTGCSSKIDVSDIQRYGDRRYWGTRVIIPPGTTKITEELSPDAHGKSLGNVIIRSRILEDLEKTLLGKVLQRGGRLFLYFEIGEESHLYSPEKIEHPAQVQGEEKIIRNPSEEAYASAVNVLRNIEPQSPFIFRKWKKISESDIIKIAILRICSPQTKVANLRSLEFSPDIDKLLKNETSREEVSSILRKYGIRFPDEKAKRIKYLLSPLCQYK